MLLFYKLLKWKLTTPQRQDIISTKSLTELSKESLVSGKAVGFSLLLSILNPTCLL
jgi:hypothetical protein